MSKGWIVILVCIGFIVVNAVVYAGSGRSTTAMPTPHVASTVAVAVQATGAVLPAATPVPPSPIAPATVVPAIEIVSHSTHQNVFKWLIIDGEVRNTTAKPLSRVRVHATLYDAQGKVVRTESDYAKLDTIPPGGRSPFSISVSDPPTMDRYEVIAEARS